MRKPTKAQVAAAEAEIDAEDAESVRRAEVRHAAARQQPRGPLPSEHPDHVCGLMCDGQDGWNSYCARLRRKLFFQGAR